MKKMDLPRPQEPIRVIKILSTRYTKARLQPQTVLVFSMEQLPSLPFIAGGIPERGVVKGHLKVSIDLGQIRI